MGDIERIKADVTRLAEAVADAIGLEVVQVNVGGHKALYNIQVFADKSCGGIGMAECAELNSRLVEKIDIELDCGDNYTLEVSSPGLDRDLVGYRDLRRVLGRAVQVFLKEPLEGKREVSGVLLAVREEEIMVQSRKGDVLVPMVIIDKAKQIIN